MQQSLSVIISPNPYGGSALKKDISKGTYQKEKYQKMIEIWGGPITLDDYSYKMVKLINVAKEMYEYFQEHPEYGMEFPPCISWPHTSKEYIRIKKRVNYEKVDIYIVRFIHVGFLY